MKLSSPAFKEGGIIPSLHTCEGKHLPPPLSIAQVPSEAKTLVLIMDDPDVPASIRPERMFDHWVVFNIPPHTHQIDDKHPIQGVHGRNTAGANQYFGPCPPFGEHRYFFKLYALSKKLDLPEGASKKEVEAAMRGSILAKCGLMGRYEKNKGY